MHQRLFWIEMMYMLNHGAQYVMYAPYIQRIINYKTDMEFGYDGKHGQYQPHIVRGPAAPPPPPVATAVGTSAAAHDSPLASARALLLVGLHLLLLPSLLELPLVEARNRTSLSRAARL
jgi:hypothetical protein